MGRISMPQGKGSQMHNRRDYEKIGKPTPGNIDVSKSSENITLVDKDIRQAYQEIFGEALERYNAKQKRADRKIEDYYDHIQKSKNGEKPFYEYVMQWGKREDFQTPEVRERAKEALVQYVKTFEERNPNLKLIGAYIHMDEASPHLHLDYVPVAHGYTRGLETRNSLDKAMKQMGFQPENESRKNNATKLWKENERAVFSKICRGLGLEVEPEQKSERKSLTVEEYKEARDEMIGEIEQEKEALVADVDTYRQLAVSTAEVDAKGKTVLPGVVVVKKKNYVEVKEQAKAYTVNRDEISSLRERTVVVSLREQELDQREQQLNVDEQELLVREQEVLAMYEQQRDLNQRYDQSVRDRQAKADEITKLEADNAALSAELSKANVKIKSFKKALRNAYRCLTNIVKAVRVLKFGGRENSFKVDGLTKKQEKLIDGVTEYGVKWATLYGYPEMAEEMKTSVGFSQGIEMFVDPPEPPAPVYVPKRSKPTIAHNDEPSR